MASSTRHRLVAIALCLGKLTLTALLLCRWGLTLAASEPAVAERPLPVRVMVINAFGFEAAPWLVALGATREIRVPGLPAEAPAVHCNADAVCQVTTGMGHANAAASMMAVVFSSRFDLQQTYFLIAGIAGIDPARGTIGSVAWARYAVDAGIAHQIDVREAPRGWKSGYFGVLTDGPGQKPRFDYHTEVFRLDESLLQAALRLSATAALEDRDDVRDYRRKYPRAPANARPAVIQCDTASGDTWWGGARLGEQVSRWTRLLTDGQGTYCTTQQEDNATLNALTRAAATGLVDLRRVAILRSGSDFDRPYPRQSVYQSMLAQRALTGAGTIAVDNLVHAGMPLVQAILSQWPAWSVGVPAAGPP